MADLNYALPGFPEIAGLWQGLMAGSACIRYTELFSLMLAMPLLGWMVQGSALTHL
jgi:hypothetical protein